MSTSDKIALGVGIPSGIGAVAGIFFGWLECYRRGKWRKWRNSRKSKKQPEHRQANQPFPTFIVPTPAVAEMD